jgi:hypothetical protein
MQESISLNEAVSYSEHVRSQLALLLDPRAHMRDFVAKNESIIGCRDQGTFNHTPDIQSADICLADLADVATPDDDPVFLAMHKKLRAEAEKTGKAADSNVVIKQKRMSTELNMWLGTHTK